MDRPPRVWGRLLLFRLQAGHAGQTPTRVGKTLAHLWFWRPVGHFLVTLHDLAVLVRAAAWRRLPLVVRPELPDR